MKLKMKYLRHPLRTAVNAGNRAARYVDLRRFGDRSESHYRGDARYNLENVSRGFTPRNGDASDDAKLLERICEAYNKSVEEGQFAPATYQANTWWQQVRQSSLGPVMHALRTRDIDALGPMYANFFRDPCSNGLTTVPYGMSKAYFGGPIKDIHRRFFLGDALHGIDYWTAQTNARFPLCELAGPDIGNPFGLLIDGTLVRPGAAFQHYSARRVCDCLGSETGVVAEIGGGFGGMAYYLLRDRPRVKYFDFDVPETIALASYYLLKAFPQLNFLLYGEGDLTPEEFARADVVLMPVFEMEWMPSESVDIVFSSHAISDISHQALSHYLNTIARITRSEFIYMGDRRGADSISELATKAHYLFRPLETRRSGWNVHIYPKAGEVESLYRAMPDSWAQ